MTAAMLPLLVATLVLALSMATPIDAQCSKVRLRKSLNQLSSQEWAAFNQGIRAMKASGALDRLTRRHRSGMAWHGTPYFFLMHRALMVDFENELLKVAPLLTGAPYWDELREGSGVTRSDVFTLARLGPMANGPLQGVMTGLRDDSNNLVTRSPPRATTGFTWLPPSQVLAQALNKFANYGDFVSVAEVSPHNQFHVLVGGHMGNPSISPSDPAFWVHHAYIDLLWALWQSMRPQNRENLYVSGASSQIRPQDPVVVYPERWTNMDMLRYRTRLCYQYTMPALRQSALKRRSPMTPSSSTVAKHPQILTQGDVERHLRAAVSSVVNGTEYNPEAPPGDILEDGYTMTRPGTNQTVGTYNSTAPAFITSGDVLRYLRAAVEAVSSGGEFKPAAPQGDVPSEGPYTAGNATSTSSATTKGSPVDMIASILGGNSSSIANAANTTIGGLPLYSNNNYTAAIVSVDDLDRHIRAALSTVVNGTEYRPDAPPGEVAGWSRTAGSSGNGDDKTGYGKMPGQYFPPLYQVPEDLVYKIMPNMSITKWRQVEEKLNCTIRELNDQISKGEVDPVKLPTVASLMEDTGFASNCTEAAGSGGDDYKYSLIPEVRAKEAAALQERSDSSAPTGTGHARAGLAIAGAIVAALSIALL